MPSLIQASRQEWSSNYPPTQDEIQSGCAQRIAIAVELMAKNYAQLVADRELYEKWYREQRDRAENYYKTIIGLRGQIGKLKARAQRAEKAVEKGTNG